MTSTTPLDLATLLDTEEAIALFLADALASGDPAVIEAAEATAQRARTWVAAGNP